MDITLIIKGFIIGLAKIVPGVSGSLIALNLGLYEKSIKAISNFFKNINNFAFLFNVGFGILLGITLGSRIINLLLNKHAFFTMISFIGMLLGSNIVFFKNTKTKNEYLYMIITFFIMSVLFFIKTRINYVYSNNISNNIYVIFLGFLDASTMIIPAISGTVIFMLLGSYNFILSIFSNVFENIKITILFFIGLFIGIIVMSKLMNNLLENRKEIIYPIVNGFFLSSMLYMIITTLKMNYTLIEFVISIPLLFISYKVGTLSNK